MDKGNIQLFVLSKRSSLNIKKQTYRNTKNKYWILIYHVKETKKAHITIVILEKANFRKRKIIRDKKEHFIMIK
jgi:hypothetical protein